MGYSRSTAAAEGCQALTAADAMSAAVIYIRKVIDTPLTQTSAEDYVATLTHGSEALFALQERATRTLQGLLDRRVRKFRCTEINIKLR